MKGYDLSKPDQYYYLPEILHEISGLTQLDSASFVCIQDEKGVLFTVDARKNKIKSQVPFGPDGDYEAIARVGRMIYILRSDGVLFEVENVKSGQLTPRTYSTNVPAINSEGLCLDARHNRLLIGCKSKPGKGPEYKDQRVIYGFDLFTKQVTDKPVYQFSIEAVKRFATLNNIELPLKEKGKNVVPILKFSTSEIAIHPYSQHLYLLSATDHLLLVFDEKGDLLQMEKLDPVIFNKAEGITFFENGDMLITNEGQLGKPSVLRFKYKPLTK